MTRPTSGRNDYDSVQKFFHSILENSFKIAGAIFAAVSLFLIWGMLNGTLAGTRELSPAEYADLAYYVYSASNLLTICGIIVIFCAAARYYNDETTGYVLLIIGGLFYWAMPIAANIQSEQMAELIVHIVNQFRLVGAIAIFLSIPFMLYNLWVLIKAEKAAKNKTAKCVTQKAETESDTKSIGIGFNCWQTAYCREHMRKICEAYKNRKPCWRSQSGCYCDENMILRALRAGSGADDKFYDIYRNTSKKLSWMQKKQRCEQCIMFIDHQKLKYRILSPIGVILPVGIVWAYFEPLKSLIHNALIYTYDFTDKISVIVRMPQIGTPTITQAMSSTGTVEVIFLICLTIILITFAFKTMEYLIFKMGV